MTQTADDIRCWITARVAVLARLPVEQVDPLKPVVRYGIDSVALISLAGELEDRYGYQFRANPFRDTPTIESLSRFLAERVHPCRSPSPE